jgi:hypothetical protein
VALTLHLLMVLRLITPRATLRPLLVWLLLLVLPLPALPF